MNVKKRFLTQRRNGATEDTRNNCGVFRCAVAPLREKFFMTLPVAPVRFAFLHKRFHAFIRVLRLHQLV